PAADNPNLARPVFESAARSMVWHGTGADGKIRLPLVPGKSQIKVITYGSELPEGEPLTPFTPYRPLRPVTVDLKPGETTEITIEVDRGQTATRTAVDATGQPQSGLV